MTRGAVHSVGQVGNVTASDSAFLVDGAGQCLVPHASTRPRPGTATLTVGRESVTLDPLLPRDEFDRRAARWDDLARRAFRK